MSHNPVCWQIRGLQGVKQATLQLPASDEATAGSTLPLKELRIAVVSGIANARKLLNEMRAGSAPPLDFVEVRCSAQHHPVGHHSGIHPSRNRELHELAGAVSHIPLCVLGVPMGVSCSLPCACRCHPRQVMTCPGGCIGGGGQPKSRDPSTLSKRMQVRATHRHLLLDYSACRAFCLLFPNSGSDCERWGIRRQIPPGPVAIVQAVYGIDAAAPLRKSHENPEVCAR